jgi:hypothetical protein
MGAAGRTEPNSLESDVYNNSRLDVVSTTLSVSSSDLDSAHSNAADSQSLLQPAQAYRNLQLQPIRTVPGMHAPMAGAHGHFDERGTQPCCHDNSSSLFGHHDTGNATQHLHQLAEDDFSPTKLAIRRGHQMPSNACVHNPSTSAQVQAAPFQSHTCQSFFQSQQHAPGPIMEEPYELSDMGQRFHATRPEQFSAFENLNAHSGFHQSVPFTKSPEPHSSPVCQRSLDVYGFEWRSDVEGSSQDMFPISQTHSLRSEEPTPPFLSSPHSVTCSGSPHKLAIRRMHQDSGHTGASHPIYYPCCFYMAACMMRSSGQI